MNTLQIISELFVANNYNKYQPEDRLPYHRFNAYDYEKLLNPSDCGQEFVFKNQDGEILKFKLTKSTLGKKTYKTLNVNNEYQKHFCYDEQEIQLECSKNNMKLTYNLKKFPTKFNQNTNEFDRKSTFLASIQFPDWNENHLIAIDYSKPLSTVIINNVFYTKVRVLDINNHLKIYFDEQKGIIGFDDYDGKIWRINN